MQRGKIRKVSNKRETDNPCNFPKSDYQSTPNRQSKEISCQKVP